MSHIRPSRRDLLAAGATGALSAPFAKQALASGVFGSVDETLKVGLIGCGGRGTGAARDCVLPNKDVVLVAMGDVFADRLTSSAGYLANELKDKFQVKDDCKFVGWDAFTKVIAQDVDIVILTTPPGFRPTHFEAAINAGKHVFMEKPVATDAPGIRKVLASAAEAKKRHLSVVAGTQRRSDVGYRAIMDRIHKGAIGEVTSLYAYWNQGGLWMNPRQEGWSDMEWQLRNWLYFTWLSGDHICEQHVHNLDVCNWAMRGTPVSAVGHGGRQVRTDPAYGHIFDHFAIEYTYASGAKMISFCRQIDGTASRVSETIVGTRGRVDTTTQGAMSIKGARPFTFDKERPNPYEYEHTEFINAIRSGKPRNDGEDVANSTLTAIMGRMAAYTGQEITWEQAMSSAEDLIPTELNFGPMPVPPVATPGKTQLV